MASEGERMREIKFRAWDSFNNEMYLITEDINCITVKDLIFNNLELETLMQYTGLKDKNGAMIYEDDIILKSFHIKNKETKEERVDITNYKVYWGHQEADYEQSYFYGWMKESLKGGMKGGLRDGKDISYNNPYWDCLELKYEVIGNIHENPELLKDN